MLSKNGNENVPSSVLKAKLLSFATLVNDNFQNEFPYVLNYLALGYENINSDIHGTRIPRTPLQSNISNASQTSSQISIHLQVHKEVMVCLNCQPNESPRSSQTTLPKILQIL